MSGTQLSFQSNGAELETALGKQKTRCDQGQKSLPVGASTKSPWAQSQQTPPRSLENYLLDLRTSGEWNTTSAKRQVRTPDIWAPSLEKESLPAESTLTTKTQERAGLLGLLIEANIITEEQAPTRDNYNN